MGAFSPITVALGLLTGGCEFGFRAYWLIIWAMGGTGIVVLARHLSAPCWAAYMAAVGFMFSGIYIGHAEHTCFLAAISFLPWILWRLDAAIVKRSFWAAAQAGALFGLSALAGYPGMVIISGCFACSWLAGGIWLRAESAAADKPLPGRGLCVTAFDKLRRTIAAAAVFLAVAAVVMSPTYLGFMVEARGYSDLRRCAASRRCGKDQCLASGGDGHVCRPVFSDCPHFERGGVVSGDGHLHEHNLRFSLDRCIGGRRPRAKAARRLPLVPGGCGLAVLVVRHGIGAAA